MLIGEKVILEEIDYRNIEELRVNRNNPDIRKYFREWKDITSDKQELWYKTKGNNSTITLNKKKNIPGMPLKLKVRVCDLNISLDALSSHSVQELKQLFWPSIKRLICKVLGFFH
jgi:hypothetical protein